MARFDLAATAVIASLGAAAVRATILLALTALGTALGRRASAASLHLAWTVGLAASLAAMALPFALPSWPVVPAERLPVMHVLSTRAVVPAVNVDSDSQPPGLAVDGPRVQAPVRSQASVNQGTSLSWSTLAAGIWLMGLLAVAGRYDRSRRALRRLARRSTELREGDLGREIGAVTHAMPLARPVRFLVSDEVDVPLTWGILRPAVLVPAEATEWDRSLLQHVVRHELAHVSRWDAATQLMAQVAAALFWFHPIVWYACRELRRTRERACDDYVLAAGASRTAYAAHLLAMVRSHEPLSPVSLAIARRSEFEGRLLALLDPAGRHRLPSVRQVVVMTAVGVACLIPVATVGAAAVPPERPHLDLVAETPAVVSAPPPLAVAPPPRSLKRTVIGGSAADLFAGCAPATDIHDHQNGDGLAATWTVNVGDARCRLMLDAVGDLRFNEQDTALAGISAGGHFDLSVTVGSSVTRVRAVPDADGLAYTFTRNDRPEPFDATATAWVASALMELDRYTAFAINERWPSLVRGGVPAVLDDVTRLQTARARSVYLDRLIATTPLDEAALRRILALIVAPSMLHESASFLRRLAARYPLSGVALTPVLTLAEHTPRDEDRAQILMALPAASLEAATRAKAVAIAGTIADDRLRTRVLATLGYRDRRGTRR